VNDYLSALYSRSARLRSIAAVEVGAVHSLHAEPVLRVLVNDQSPILISTWRSDRRWSVQRMYLATLRSGKPIDQKTLVEAILRKKVP
jgi:hypothetical protein